MIAAMRISLLFLALPLMISCMSDSDHGGGSGPAAPTNLAAAPLSGGVHLTWTDNSSNEDEFMVMRKTGTGGYEHVTSVTFNTTQYHDAAVTAGTAYTYQVTAMNDGGESPSNEVTITP
jgi:fibronectin type 3 domain-containing protein